MLNASAIAKIDFGEALGRARRATLHAIWWADCFAAALGWMIVILIALSGFNLVVATFLMGDFFTHYADASEDARRSFHWFAVPALGVVFAITAGLRWHTRSKLLTEDDEPGKVEEVEHA